MQVDASSSVSGESVPSGAWVWSRERGQYVRVHEPRFFDLHPIEEADPRVHTLARGERVAVHAVTWLLWSPDFVPSAGSRLRGLVAMALDLGQHDRSPQLWVGGRPFVFLTLEADAPAWLSAERVQRGVWVTYDGGSLHAVRGVHRDLEGRVRVDVERVVG